ncbi:universal stress protein [Micromonospora sp. B11E3]|uniref:universal stress protein n=1 Tax=Micromonospora sp. B11E3 TaxID=3153562 RepID=UPI00325C4101
MSIEHRTVPGRPAAALLDAACDAQLLVVGARGRGGFTGLLLGSTSHAVLHHAPCPVAIVRGQKDGVSTGAPPTIETG